MMDQNPAAADDAPRSAEVPHLAMLDVLPGVVTLIAPIALAASLILRIRA